MKVDLSRRNVALAAITVLVAFATVSTWANLGYIIECQERIIDQQQLIIQLLETGRIESTGQGLGLNVEVHVTMYHWRDGRLVGYSHHEGTLTNLGKDYIEGKLLNNGFGNNSDYAEYIGLSNSTDSPSASWVTIPDEITTGNMGRAQGTYADNGVGSGNISKAFSPSETNSTQLVGLYHKSYASGENSLVASDNVTLVNYENGDTVTIVWTISVS